MTNAIRGSEVCFQIAQPKMLHRRTTSISYKGITLFLYDLFPWLPEGTAARAAPLTSYDPNQ
ncbi:hypothetical protein PTI98_000577 [Pleurotus ostreatus]|nr:hypothetical protein PTI98_000577 [Pleurotus ostreatus]